MTERSSKTLRSLGLATFLVVLCLAGVFYLVELPRVARAAILSQLDDGARCVSLGGVTPGPCDHAE